MVGTQVSRACARAVGGSEERIAGVLSRYGERVWRAGGVSAMRARRRQAYACPPRCSPEAQRGSRGGAGSAAACCRCVCSSSCRPAGQQALLLPSFFLLLAFTPDSVLPPACPPAFFFFFFSPLGMGCPPPSSVLLPFLPSSHFLLLIGCLVYVSPPHLAGQEVPMVSTGGSLCGSGKVDGILSLRGLTPSTPMPACSLVAHSSLMEGDHCAPPFLVSPSSS